jgi:O-Antigen ligase
LNRNYVAGYLVMALPVACSVALRRSGLGLAAVGFSTVVAVATRCRSGYLALLASLALVLAVATLRALREKREASAGGGALGGHSVAARALEGRQGARRPVAALAGVLVLGAAAGALAPWPGVHFNQSATQAAGRLFEHDRGSGHARLEQHRVGLAILGAAPSRWLFGAGPGAWEDAASEQAHAALGRHASLALGPNSPNSDALRVLVEQGLVGIACLAAAFALALRGALGRALGGGSLAPALGASAGLVAALVHGLFDAPLFRAESVALLGVLVGVVSGSEGATRATGGRRWLVGYAPLVVAASLAAFAFCRGVSFFAAGSGPSSAEGWEGRQEFAARLSARPEIFEQLAIARARRGRCDEAEGALGRLNELRPHHWGARVEVSSCFTKAGRRHDARRIWDEAQRVEAHLDEVVGSLKATRAVRARAAHEGATPATSGEGATL